MPKALDADWNLAQALYVQGVPYADIAEKIGVTPPTLRQYAHRYHWRRLRETVMASVSQVIAKPLVERAHNSRDKLAQEIERQASLLSECPPESVEQLANNRERQGRAAVVKTVAEAAEKVFGWQSQEPAGLVQIGHVEQLLLKWEQRGERELDGLTVLSDNSPSAPSDVPGRPASA
jgi:transposase-like protein